MMQTIGTPLQTPELGLLPDQAPGVPLSENMQQALALLCGFWHNKRILCRISPTGVLSVGDAPLQDVIHVQADGDNDTYQGANVPCNQVIVMGHPSNTGNVWVRVNTTATTANAWPLAKGEVISFGVANLKQLQLLIAKDDEYAIIAYS
jgi:hypothetical protein